MGFEYTLPGNIGVKECGEIMEALKTELKEDTNLCLNAQAVEFINSSAIQMLIALDLSLARLRGELQIKDASAACKQAFYNFGIKAQFDKWSKIYG